MHEDDCRYLHDEGDSLTIAYEEEFDDALDSPPPRRQSNEPSAVTASGHSLFKKALDDFPEEMKKIISISNDAWQHGKVVKLRLGHEVIVTPFIEATISKDQQ